MVEERDEVKELLTRAFRHIHRHLMRIFKENPERGVKVTIHFAPSARSLTIEISEMAEFR
jgi:hypothetical protein